MSNTKKEFDNESHRQEDKWIHEEEAKKAKELKEKNSKKTIVIASGYFNPVHYGHIKYLRDAKELGDYLLIIINNDIQQTIKKGRIILTEKDRYNIMTQFRFCDNAIISDDKDLTQCVTLSRIRNIFKDERLLFVNGGDRTSYNIPETNICDELNIEMVFGVGGDYKEDSSTRINRLLGDE